MAVEKLEGGSLKDGSIVGKSWKTKQSIRCNSSR